ncbi:kinase-like domain-containing protein [Phellopilus nigrolimitatus]|nr:kinase-like domain-containing protein [Phellopilus nigrolimitatus]
MTRPSDLKYYREIESDGSFSLLSSECWWRDHYEFLLSRGYQLRPRYHPGWKPSWLETDIFPYACEDAHSQIVCLVVMDAKRVRDGKIVAVKKLSADSREAQIGLMLSSSERLQDPTNHCVPIFDTFVDEQDNQTMFIVMPLLRAFNDPDFEHVDEAVDFVRQALEGLVYMHSRNVAHRDLSDLNIMMDGRPLFDPDGFHPAQQYLTARDLSKAKPRSRSDVERVRYYFTDFGISTHFEDDNRPRLVVGNVAAEEGIPELSLFIPYDPFRVDVFTLGMVFKRNLLDVYKNLLVLAPLIHEMTKEKPEERITAPQAFELFEQLITTYPGYARRWCLHSHDERSTVRFNRNIRSVFRELSYLSKSLGSKSKFLTNMFLVIPGYLMHLVQMRNCLLVKAAALLPLSVASFLLFTGPRRYLLRLRRWLFG